ncbi:ATP-binding protein [Nostoc sp. CHAB 5784]|uniref:AAA family ATPase n=1 Tax=Nostoc mirabile TaxID=2907820 RepID=UPI001E3A7221|nr:ATP-binding protein [Nostoc mirabile]MCC5668322.1 ATP-binding protein [Nostoc mirabile CHAB5784]
MKLNLIYAKDIPPVKQFFVDKLSNVVVIAGPNGVGKTRLIQGLLQAFQSNGSYLNIRLIIEATAKSESEQWGKDFLDTSIAEDSQKLAITLQQNRSRTRWVSSVIQFESNRTIQQIQPYSFTWDIIDPWEELIGWNYSFYELKNRFQDTLHSLFRKVQSRRNEIARKAEILIKQGERTMSLDFPDPLLPFKNAFSQLLAPKELLEPEARQQELFYSYEGQQFPLSSLSSGEREVVNIIFDFLLRNPSHSIIIFDEPELHLHPELSYKLLQTIQTIGNNNQFIYCTHSPDIITASLENSVIFIAPPIGTTSNQAILVREDDETHEALQKIGQSIGIVALGKKLVLVEGSDSSLDKQVYGAILKNKFPNLVLVPSGGKEVITSFSSIITSILERTIWGVEFFMLCDRDAVPLSVSTSSLEDAGKGRFKILKCYHLENYFLDEKVLAGVFSMMEREDSWLCNPDKIRLRLREIAKKMIPYTAALIESAKYRSLVGNLDIMPKGCHDKSSSELAVLIQERTQAERKRIVEIINDDDIKASVMRTVENLQQSLENDTDDWKSTIPGKQLFNRFASETKIDTGRLKTLYLREADNHSPYPFADIVAIFEQFARM